MTDAVATDAIAAARKRVADALSVFDTLEANDDGTCSLRYGSALVRVEVDVFDEDSAVVKVASDCVRGATPSPELYHHVATYRTEIGHLRAFDEDDGTVTVQFRHGLIADFLDDAELRMVVIAVAHISDELDDGIAARFGGRVFDASANTA